MPKFRKKPVVIEAVRWDGHEGTIKAVFDLNPVLPVLPDDGQYVGGPGLGYVPALGTLDIPTLEGTMTAQPGDWIIRGVQGEIYPCKPDIFEATYEPVDDVHPNQLSLDQLEDDRGKHRTIQ